MVADGCTKLHCCSEQRLVRCFVVWTLSAVDVVAQHQHKMESGFYAAAIHPLSDVVPLDSRTLSPITARRMDFCSIGSSQAAADSPSVVLDAKCSPPPTRLTSAAEPPHAPEPRRTVMHSSSATATRVFLDGIRQLTTAGPLQEYQHLLFHASAEF